MDLTVINEIWLAWTGAVPTGFIWLVLTAVFVDFFFFGAIIDNWL